jgi:hypothetical protein
VKALITRGEFYSSYEPHDMPGAFIVTRHAVIDSTGGVEPKSIAWDGPAIWIESRDGVPGGYKALWLGTQNTTRPFIVYVRDAMTPESNLFDRAYRRGWKAKRRPSIPQTYTGDEVDGVRQGWKDNPNNPSPGEW